MEGERKKGWDERRGGFFIFVHHSPHAFYSLCVCVWLGLAAAVVCNNARAKVIVGPAGTKSAEKPGLTGGAAEPFIGRRMRVTIMTNSLIALKENIHVRLMID